MPTGLPVAQVPTDYAGIANEVTWTAADNVNGNSMPGTGDCILLIQGDGADTVVVSSTPDSWGRSADISISIPSGTSTFVLPMLPADGYVQSDGTIHIAAGETTTQFAVLQEVV